MFLDLESVWLGIEETRQWSNSSPVTYRFITDRQVAICDKRRDTRTEWITETMLITWIMTKREELVTLRHRDENNIAAYRGKSNTHLQRQTTDIIRQNVNTLTNKIITTSRDNMFRRCSLRHRVYGNIDYIAWGRKEETAVPSLWFATL